MAITDSEDQLISNSWYAVQVKTTHEKRVVSMLDYSGIESFLPLYETRRPWADRIKKVELPLFPGYIFCRFGPSGRVPILKTPSVTRIVGIGYIPTPIDEKEIVAIQTVVRSGLGVFPHPYLKVGNRVRIQGGSLYGMEGIVTEFRRRDHLIISVNLLQRSVAVEIDSAWVTPVQHPKPEKSALKPILSAV